MFAIDVMVCPRCAGPMKVIACLQEPTVATAIWRHLGLHAEPLPAARAQAPPVTLELFGDP